MRPLFLSALCALGFTTSAQCSNPILFVAVSGDGTVVQVDVVNKNYKVVVSKLNTPYGLTFDNHGYMYVSDTDNNAIKRVAPDWSVSTVASGLNYPSGLYSDCGGGLVVANFGANCVQAVMVQPAQPDIACGLDGPVSVREWTSGWHSSRGLLLVSRGVSSGRVDLYSQDKTGTWNNQQAVGTGLSLPYDAVPNRAGDVFVSEMGKQRILKFAFGPGGVINTNPTVFASGLSPVGLLFDHAGNLYEADYGGTINKFAVSNGVLSSMPSPIVTGLNLPTYIAAPPAARVEAHHSGGQLELSWPDAMYDLQTATALSSGFTTITGAASPYTNPVSGSSGFFRLHSK